MASPTPTEKKTVKFPKSYSQRLVEFLVCECTDLEEKTLQVVVGHVRSYAKQEKVRIDEENKARASVLQGGKYANKPISKVAIIDPSYIEWVSRQPWCNKYQKAAIEEALA